MTSVFYTGICMTCAFHCFPGENKINEMEISDGTFLFVLLCAWIFATVTCDINTVAKDRSSAEDAVLEFDDPRVWTRGAQRKRCWGYEKDCSESQQMFRNTPCIRSKQNDYDRRRRDFWRYGDWGYVAHYKNSMQDICTQRAASDSLLRCSTENTMCIARNLFIDLRQLNHTQHSNSYRTDVFAKKGMLGGRCKMHEDRLPKGKQPDVLMTWVDELKMYDSLKFKPQPNAKQCDVWIEKPTIIMKFDSGVNLYHHFCDFFNLYATQHVNGSFTRDVNILMWNTGGMGYHDMFKAVWAAFTHAGDFTLLTRYDGQRVCFRDAVFSLNPRMGLGLFYSTPIPVKCSGSGLFKAFHRHMVHRLNLTDTREHLGTPGYKLRIKFMSRKTRWRRVLNEDELISALHDTGKYDVEVSCCLYSGGRGAGYFPQQSLVIMLMEILTIDATGVADDIRNSLLVPRIPFFFLCL